MKTYTISIPHRAGGNAYQLVVNAETELLAHRQALEYLAAEGVELAHASIHGTLAEAFNGAIINGLVIRDSTLSGIDLAGASADRLQLQRCRIERMYADETTRALSMVVESCHISDSCLNKINAKNSQWNGVTLWQTQLLQADLRGSLFRSVKLQNQSSLAGCRLDYADVRGLQQCEQAIDEADMSDEAKGLVRGVCAGYAEADALRAAWQRIEEADDKTNT